MDETTLELRVNVPVEKFIQGKPFTFLGFDFVPDYNPKSQTVKYFKAFYGSLYLRLFENKLRIENSLSGFYFSENTKNLSFSELTNVIERICEQLECTATELKILKVAFCLTIELDILPKSVFDLYVSHKGKLGVPMMKGAREYGKKFYHDDYSFKVYDKAQEQWLHYGRKVNKNLLRMEMQLKKSDVFPKGLDTLYDLLNPSILLDLFTLFIKQFDSIIKKPLINYASLSPKKIEQIIAWHSSEYWSIMSERNRTTAKTYKRRFKMQMKDFGSWALHYSIREKLSETFYALLGDNNVPSFPPCNIQGINP